MSINQPMETRGGMRPTAPQNNPANISATGGAGQSGTQPAKYISGMPYGQGQELMAQQTAAPMAGKPPMPVFAKELGTLLDPTNNPDEPITAGVDMGPGPGSDILPKNINADTRADENKMIVQKYLPTLLYAANLPDTPDSYKRFINYLLEQQ
jgi:hypothetical protein